MDISREFSSLTSYVSFDQTRQLLVYPEEAFDLRTMNKCGIFSLLRASHSLLPVESSTENDASTTHDVVQEAAPLCACFCER